MVTVEFSSCAHIVGKNIFVSKSHFDSNGTENVSKVPTLSSNEAFQIKMAFSKLSILCRPLV